MEYSGSRSGGGGAGGNSSGSRCNRRSGVALFRTVTLFVSKGSRIKKASLTASGGIPKGAVASGSGSGGGGGGSGRGGGGGIGGGGGGQQQQRQPSVVPGGSLSGKRKGQSAGQQSEMAAAKKPTHFTRQETEALTLIYEKLIGVGPPTSLQTGNYPAVTTAPLNNYKAKQGIERTVFRDLLHNTFGVCAEDLLMDRIFCVFDSGSDGLVKLDEFLQGLSVFLRGSLAQRTAFTFAVYDLNVDGFIVRDEIFTLLRNSLVKQPGDEDPEEGVKELVDLVLRKLDRDKDGRLSFEDFKEAVEEEPLFLEAFGPCLPSATAASAFLATLS